MSAVRYRFRKAIAVLIVLFAAVFLLPAPLALAERPDHPNDDCFGDCHDDKSLTGERNGREMSVFVDLQRFSRAAHGAAGVKCVQCHRDIAKVSDLHEDDLKPVDCAASGCHTKIVEQHKNSLHGKAIAKGDPLAPSCKDCHGAPHFIQDKRVPSSPIAAMNVPYTCGKCHQEGTKVMQRREIPQDHIIENFSESIHGEGLLRKGLIVAPNCASCHSAHNILPHTDKGSTIARENISKTCTQCHAMIETVHKKVIKGELWEKQLHVLPACVDCHQPHKVRKVYYATNVANKECLACHEKPDLKASYDGRSLFVDVKDQDHSKHAKIACSQCHSDVTPNAKERPCATVRKKVDCTSCHEAVGKEFFASKHGELATKNDENGPTCKECHGTHGIKSPKDPESKVFATNVPVLCATCHREGEAAAKRYEGKQHQIDVHYRESIHGKGLNESGLIIAATCASCHSAHGERPKDDPLSTVNPKNVANTCGTCHYGIEHKFEGSVHSPLANKTDKDLPVCSDCHTAHTISQHDRDPFRLKADTTCGTRCHKEQLETYDETFHGKAIALGRPDVATCFDCHGSHDIRKLDDPKSTVGPEKRIDTCRKCHQGADPKFASYLVHASHKDRKNYPELFYTFVAMTGLLFGTFIFFAIHTALWLGRTWIEWKKDKQGFKAIKEKQHEDPISYTRFRPLDRFLHGMVITSFIILVATGMPLKFHAAGWAQVLLTFFGGQEFASVLHRLGAIITGGYFLGHILSVIGRVSRRKENYRNPETGKLEPMRLVKLAIGPDSPIPGKQDLLDIIANMKWFVKGGERPQFDRWTYWEKFDYMAVFWGVFMIGVSGLIMWFPVFFTKFLPGWAINIALIIHSDEALLAAGFIFTFHFFNVHLRPEKFPIDPVIFSGRISETELLHERKKLYERWKAEGTLEDHKWKDEWSSWKRIVLPVGYLAWFIGIGLIILIVYALLMH
jgi:cytochrome b subunit of formate dehydrogenase